jgi:FtsZ-binding cell division protein ZapB
VFSSFKETQDTLQTAIEVLESIKMPIEQLKEKMDTFDNVIETIKLGLEIQNNVWLAVRDIQGKLNGATSWSNHCHDIRC